MPFTDAERRFLADASSRVKHLENAQRDEEGLVERIDALTNRLAGLRETIRTIELAIRTGIDELTARAPGPPGGGP